MIWIIKENNFVVTDYYLDIIGKALTVLNHELIERTDIQLNDFKKNDIFVVANISKAYKLLKYGYTKVIVWYQGIVPEESYMRHKNIIRKKILDYIECYVLKNCAFSIFVSNEMKKHYENKYNILIKNNYYVMPCFNTKIDKHSFFIKDKYDKNIFVYIGSLSPWQNFESVLEYYKNIEKYHFINTKLLVLTQEEEKAKKLINKSEIKNYEVTFVQQSELSKILSNVKFGFIIRNDSKVNQVATPTKISTYLGNGIIPIYSSSLRDFSKQAKVLKYAILHDANNFYDNLEKFIEMKIDPDDIYNEYQKLFNQYYNSELHCDLLMKKFDICFNNKKK